MHITYKRVDYSVDCGMVCHLKIDVLNVTPESTRRVHIKICPIKTKNYL